MNKRRQYKNYPQFRVQRLKTEELNRGVRLRAMLSQQTTMREEWKRYMSNGMLGFMAMLAIIVAVMLLVINPTVRDTQTRQLPGGELKQTAGRPAGAL